MCKQLARSIFAAVVLLPVLASSSALASPHMRSAKAHAGRRSAPVKPAGRRPRRKPGAVVRRQGSHGADKVSTTVLLGDKAVESQSDSLPAGQAEAFRLQARASGPGRTARAFLAPSSAASTLIVGLYSDVDGHPGALLSTGVAPAQSGSWSAVPIAQIELVAGRTYWLALLGKGGTLRYRDRRRGRCPSETSGQRALGALPAAWRTGTIYADCPASAFVAAEDSVSQLDLRLPVVPPSQLEPPAPTAPTSASDPQSTSDQQEPPPSPEDPSPEDPPVNQTPPAIDGTPIAGQTLQASSGVWSGSPSSYAYQWQDCDLLGTSCSNVAGARSASYTLATRDVTHAMRVLVTATNASGSASADSALTAAVVSSPPPAPANTASPTVSGTALEGTTLSAGHGSWTGSPSAYAYQWQDCDALGLGCTNIGGAASSTYKLAPSDVGDTVRVVVTATNAGGSTSASSAATAIVLPVLTAPINLLAPAVTGLAVEGETLSATTGSWLGSPTSYAYQWQDCNSLGGACANVSGATAASYTLTASDVGHTARVVVRASNAAGSASASSAATALVVATSPPPSAPANVTPPTISGEAQVGQVLSAGTGTWSGSPTSFAYQWQDCNSAGGSCANIGGATTSTHLLAPSDAGHTIRAVVTASNAAGSSSASSNATAEVAANTGGGGAPEPACTVETESTATAKADLAINGEVVCLKGGGSPYPSISISAGPSTTNATLVSAPGQHVVVKGVTIAASHITVEGLRIEGGINVGTGNSTAYNHDVIAWNDISNSSGDGVGVFAKVEGPVAEFINIEHNKIHNTSVTTEGDAVHAQGWANLTVKENDIYEISEEACKGACHDDIFQSYNAGFKTAHDFVFEKNYVHDNDTEGILLKDGDTAANATIRDNLMVRDERWGGIAGVWVDDCTHGLAIERNTLTEGNNVQPLSGSCVEPSAVIKQNVFGRMKLGGESASGIYALTSEQNVFAESPAGLYKTGLGDETKSLSGSATYKCSPGCKVGSDDYRLATNPKAAGIDWNPSEQSWGPNH